MYCCAQFNFFINSFNSGFGSLTYGKLHSKLLLKLINFVLMIAQFTQFHRNPIKCKRCTSISKPSLSFVDSSIRQSERDDDDVIQIPMAMPISNPLSIGVGLLRCRLRHFDRLIAKYYYIHKNIKCSLTSTFYTVLLVSP